MQKFESVSLLSDIILESQSAVISQLSLKQRLIASKCETGDISDTRIILWSSLWIFLNMISILKIFMNEFSTLLDSKAQKPLNDFPSSQQQTGFTLL